MVILTAHMEDGASMADITKETDEPKKEGRIRYLVVAEEKRVWQSGQEEQNSVGTRGSRDAEGGRPQRVKKAKAEASTAGQRQRRIRSDRVRVADGRAVLLLLCCWPSGARGPLLWLLLLQELLVVLLAVLLLLLLVLVVQV